MPIYILCCIVIAACSEQKNLLPDNSMVQDSEEQKLANDKIVKLGPDLVVTLSKTSSGDRDYFGTGHLGSIAIGLDMQEKNIGNSPSVSSPLILKQTDNLTIYKRVRKTTPSGSYYDYIVCNTISRTGTLYPGEVWNPFGHSYSRVEFTTSTDGNPEYFEFVAMADSNQYLDETNEDNNMSKVVRFRNPYYPDTN